MIITLYAKCRLTGQAYTVELNYKFDGKYILRPCGWIIPRHFQQFITQTAEQVKNNFRLFPVFRLEVQS